MVSIRKSPQSVEARILDAAAACILAYGVERTTLTEIARMLSGDTVTKEARAAARALLAG